MSSYIAIETAMPRRPHEVAALLGIAPVTLRVWSNEFAALLSESARRTVTSDGRTTQRRYSETDIEVFKRARVLLDNGATFDEARRRLLSAETASPSLATLATLGDTAQYLAELKALYDEGLAAREQALASKDETIHEQRSHIETLQHNIERLEQRISELQSDIDAKRGARPGWWRRLFGGE